MLKYLGEMLLFMYFVRSLEKELCYPVLTKVEKWEREAYVLYFKSETETHGNFQKMSSPDAASDLHITWESVVRPHIRSCWMCSAHFPVGRMGLMLSQQYVLLSFLLFLFTCLLAYLLFALSLPCKWFWGLWCEWTIPVQP